MSASGQWPGARNGVQLATRANWEYNAPQLSQKSPLIRHIFALVDTSAPRATEEPPGEIEKTIGRPV